MDDRNRSRRQFLGRTALGLLAGSSYFATRDAIARQTITAVEWGGTWLDASNAILADQSEFQVNWVLHAGSSSTIIAKIKASLPKVNYDVVHAFPPVTHPMMLENWLEPLSFDDVPNLRDVPDHFLTRNNNGQIINCPTSSIGALWGYRPDLVRKPIRTAQDLLDPTLKGKICGLAPTLQSGRFLLSLALERGGDERNIGPGFEFAKELARSGNIGRVATSDIHVVNSITSGETAVGFTNIQSWTRIAQSQKLEYLIKRPESHKAFKIFISQEEWSVLRGAPNVKGAKEFVNWFISPAVHEKYCALLGALPINHKSRAPEKLSFLVLNDEADRKRYMYYPDYPYIASQLKVWNERWEAEVAPLF